MSLYSFGRGENGELAQGNTNDLLDPVLIDSIPGTVVQVQGGEKHAVAINDVGEVYTWGRAREGQLGIDSRDYIQESPVLVSALREERVVAVACGAFHTLAVTNSGEVYQWGKLHKFLENPMYFGSGSIEMVGMVDEMPEWKKRLKRMLDESNRQYYSEGTEETSIQGNIEEFSEYPQRSPMLVRGLEGIKIVEVYAGFSFSFCVSEERKVYAWGFNGKKQLGIGNRFNQEIPQPVSGLNGLGVVKIACGEQHAMALDSAGHIYSWGLGTFGQLGHGNISDKGNPELIEALCEENIVDISCGVHHSIAIDDKGHIYTWGNNEYGQQGAVNEFEDWGNNLKDFYYSIPRRIESKYPLKKIVCGSHFNAGITFNDEIVTWGWGINGMLGHGDRRFQVIPTRIERLRGEKAINISAANCSTFVVMENRYSSYAKDFGELLESEENSDLTIVVGGKEMKLHKVIIYNRCTYLRDYAEINKIFQGDETLSLPYDFYPFRSLVKYLYTDKLNAVSHHIPSILEMARTFELGRLEQLCLRYSKIFYNESVGDIAVPPSTFSTDLSVAINSDQTSDVTFTFDDGNTLGGHKSLLKLRSDYFKTIFESQFRESNQREIHISEISSPIFQILLNYIYSDQVELEVDNVVDVLIASDRFLLKRMKQKLEILLEKEITKDTVVDILNLSESTDTPKLRKSCISYLLENYTSFTLSDLSDLTPKLQNRLAYLSDQRSQSVIYIN